MPADQVLFEQRLSLSARAFRDLVWPLIAHYAGGGDLIPVEAASTRPMQAHLDRLAGIDAWQVCQEPAGMRGIASRVQPLRPGWPPLGWQTFTIRYELARGGETEWAKRLRATDNPGAGWLYPHFTAQAYVSADWGTVVSCSCTPTESLIRHAANALKRGDQTRVQIRRNQEDGNSFLVVFWAPMVTDGLDIYVWPNPAARRANVSSLLDKQPRLW